jgi:hypothetical protein
VHIESNVAAAVTRGQFRHTGCRTSAVGNRYPRANEGQKQTNKQTPWSDSASELYRPSDREVIANFCG